MSDSKNFLYFHDYSVDEMVYKRNYEFVPATKEVGIKFNLTGGATLSDEGDQAEIIVSCEIFKDEFYQVNIPFYLKMKIRGFFTCNPDVDMNDFKYNGIAILLPYLRSLITSFTAQSGINPIILPPINVYDVFEDEFQDE